MKLSEADLLAHNTFVQTLALQLARGDADEARDITQEVMLKALLNQPELKARSPRPWLATVLRNCFLRRRRDERLRKAKEHLGSYRKQAQDPAGILEIENLRHDVLRAVVSLPSRYRDIVLLRFYLDCPPREIARILEEPVETVKTRQRRALILLRGALDRQYGSRESWILLIGPVAGLTRSSGSPRRGERSVRTLTDSPPVLVGAMVIVVAVTLLVVWWGTGSRETTTRQDVTVADVTPPVAPPRFRRGGGPGEPTGITRAASRRASVPRPQTTEASGVAAERASPRPDGGQAGPLVEPRVVSVRLVTPDGLLLIEAEERARLLDPAKSFKWLDSRYVSVLASESGRLDLPPTVRGTHRRNGLSRYRRDLGARHRSGWLELLAGEGVYLHLVFGHFVLDTRWYGEDSPDTVEFTVDPEVVKSLLSDVSVRVLDGETSAPPACTVATRELGTSGSALGLAPDADGFVRFENQVAGLVIVEVRSAATEHRAPPWTHSRVVRVPFGDAAEPFELTVWKPLVVPAVFRDADGETVRVQLSRANLDRDYPFPLNMLSETGWRNPHGQYEVVIPDRGPRILLSATAIEERDLACRPKLLDTGHLPESLEFEFGPAASVRVQFTQERHATHFAEITDDDGLPVWAAEVHGPSEVRVSLLAEQDYTLLTYERAPDGELVRTGKEIDFHLGVKDLSISR